jgi:AcrR family transcriptional regulator
MARPRIIADETVFAAIRALLSQGGEKAVAFSSVSRHTGLAAPTLVQRFGTRDQMIRKALDMSWDRLMAATTAGNAIDSTPHGFLKALAEDSPDAADLTMLALQFRDPALRKRAEEWRAAVEAALTTRFGGGAKGRDAAAILFAAWQGQMLWQIAGGKVFRLKEAVKRLA